MKKLLYLLFVTLSLSLSVNSQITFDGSLPSSGNLEHFTTTSLGDKYLHEVNPQNPIDTLVVYNEDLSVYRTIIPPSGYYLSDFNVLGSTISSMSDKLFNSDTLLEFLGSKNVSGGRNITSVINELGQILFTFPDTITTGGVWIYSMGGNFKVSYFNGTKIFSVPGSLPCNQCNGFISGIVDPNQGGGLSGLNVYPNPFNNSLEINYNFISKQDNPRIIISDILGRELKSIPLVNQSDKITINTTDLPRGTMVISLYGNGQNPISKKVIKIN